MCDRHRPSIISYVQENSISLLKENGCPVTNCEFTRDRSRFCGSSLVIVHHLANLAQFPPIRPSALRTVWLQYESILTATVMGRPDFSAYDGFYNLTSTYRHDSDFNGFYEEEAGIVWERNERFSEDFDFHGAKIDPGKNRRLIERDLNLFSG